MLEIVPSYTLLISVFNLFEYENLPVNDILEILDLIETLHIRWSVCKINTSGLDQIYNEVSMGLKDLNVDDVLKHIKNSLTIEIIRNADNERFKNDFIKISLRPSTLRTKYLLWRLSKPTDETKINMNKIHTEHILPQKLSKEWKSYLEQQSGLNEDEIKYSTT